MNFDFSNGNRIFQRRTLAVPSPLNGERARVRGGQVLEVPISSSVSAGELVFPAEHYPDAARVTASPPKSVRARTEHPAIANSKTAASGCFAISNTLPAVCRALVAPEIRAGRRPVRGCSAPRHRKNPDRMRRLGADAENCRQRNDGRGESPTAFFPPKWISSAGRGTGKPDSLRNDLTGRRFQFKRCFLFPPLTLALSPLRGEELALDDSLITSVSMPVTVASTRMFSGNYFASC